jgi:hypothetical protein
MKEVMLSIEDKNYEAFINFVKKLPYVKISDDFTIEGLKRSLEEAKSMEKGKRYVKEFLKGL